MQNDNFTIYNYDVLGRVEVVNTPTGSIMTEYNGRSKKVTNAATSVWKTKTINAIGLTESITDPTGTISYEYFSSGNIKNINALGATTYMQYDGAGNQTTLTDPNAGTTIYLYNAYGELIWQKDAKENETDMEYDNFGRLKKKTLTDGAAGTVEETNYYYQQNPNIGGFGKTESISGSNGISYNYTYDELSRLVAETETIGSTDYTHSYTYHPYFNKIYTMEYPSGFEIKYDYLYNGYLDKISDNSTGDMLWQPIDNNGRGQLTDFNLGNGLATHKEFDHFGFPEAIRTSLSPAQHLQNLEYSFNPSTGNLEWRIDHREGYDLIEDFEYDIDMLHSRLTNWQVVGQQEYIIAYEPNGNIFMKTDVHDSRSSYIYGADAGPHAVTSINFLNPDYLEQATDQSIEYTAFNKIKTIRQTNTEEGEEHDYSLDFTYGPDNARKATVLTKDHHLSKIKYFIGSDYEVEQSPDGTISKLHYLYGGDGLFAIYTTTTDEHEAESNEMYYIHKDYLGSYETITNSEGGIVEKHSFDPWGRKRNPIDWTYTPSLFKGIFDRGYTGHEHMAEFGLINMNGRLYDPWLGRMLSPDPYVQAPTYSQNFNRYSYAYNNPLKYSDPSGEWIHIVIGAAIGGILNLGINAMQGNIDTFGDGFYAFGIGAAAGALAAGVGAGVGTLAAGSGSFGFGVSAGLTASGFGAGAAVGAASGFTSGMLLGTGNSLLQGYNIGQSLGRGLEAGAWGAASGAVIGGISGGIRATKIGNDFLTGRSELEAVNIKRSALNGPEVDYNWGGSRSKINSLPKQNRVWNNYRKVSNMSSKSVYNMIGGDVANSYNIDPTNFRNSCALKVSYSLNKSGYYLPQLNNSLVGNDGLNYYTQISQFEQILNGTPVSSTNPSLFSGQQGIMVFKFHEGTYRLATGHITLFNGYQTGDFSNYFGVSENVLLYKIHF